MKSFYFKKLPCEHFKQEYVECKGSSDLSDHREKYFYVIGALLPKYLFGSKLKLNLFTMLRISA